MADIAKQQMKDNNMVLPLALAALIPAGIATLGAEPQ